MIERDVFGEGFEAGRVWLDGDDAFQLPSARFLHGVVADIGAQFDDSHLIFEDGEQDFCPEGFVHFIEGEFSGDALIVGIDDEFELIEVEDFLFDIGAQVHGVPAQTSECIAWFLESKTECAAAHLGGTAVFVHGFEGAFEIIQSFLDFGK